jgi:hypothetical protein
MYTSTHSLPCQTHATGYARRISCYAHSERGMPQLPLDTFSLGAEGGLVDMGVSEEVHHTVLPYTVLPYMY